MSQDIRERVAMRLRAEVQRKQIGPDTIASGSGLPPDVIHGYLTGMRELVIFP
uniref:Uncharacterized protein n=1 Tax=Candidatus Kentrum eta TaxID=2126337 RepID=A0A450VFC8_9GAMM|nr:MAG: hypothetical protein BECKH772B_GA0070898_101342 [Candidatus Kentron sp. H]VFJ98528.1 MAG: hypothetical protein BECKH772A_GA0070896_101402 [Candidatus Kentron sp. H]VFK03496.1 MAG: hypothetical protein BECKH772C_GA0070978_101323 [Candidatus Kentron sp. H]